MRSIHRSVNVVLQLLVVPLRRLRQTQLTTSSLGPIAGTLVTGAGHNGGASLRHSSNMASGCCCAPASQLLARQQQQQKSVNVANSRQAFTKEACKLASATSSTNSAPRTTVNSRHLKEEQAKQVAPSMKQSPISFMSINPAYEPQNKPLMLEYPTTIDNLRISNTGFSWEVKIPYQISMSTTLYTNHLHRYRLDQFHCHWGDSDNQGGSEHVVDGTNYSAELHFVHYNMEKYHTMSKAARHPDGLVVVGVFLEAQPHYHNHAELDKIISQLRWIPLKGDHAIIKQSVRLENLLPSNKSYWSYHGSLTTPPYLESVTWFVLKQPIKCSASQLERFRALKSNIRREDDEQVFIRSNFRKTQPLNGRTIYTYDEPNGGTIKSPAAATNSSLTKSASSAGRQSSSGLH